MASMAYITSMSMSSDLKDEIRRAIGRDFPNTRNLALAARLSPIQLSRFLNGERTLTAPCIDRLCEVLGLKLVASKKRKRG